MEYVRIITDEVRKQDEVLKVQLMIAEDDILKKTNKWVKALRVVEAMSIRARIIMNRPDVRRRPYNPVISAQNRIYDLI